MSIERYLILEIVRQKKQGKSIDGNAISLATNPEGYILLKKSFASPIFFQNL